MTFSRVLLCLCLVSISITAVAADEHANASSGSPAAENPLLQSTNPVPDTTALTNPFPQDKADSGLLGPQKARSESYSLSDLNGDVCYTMRSYKVKRTERLTDNQTGLRGYSTCETASSYRIRSAEAKAKDSADRH